jgi:replication initiation and membrane attachment protein DnaB
MSFPLKSKLDNGATVSDWLGTAMTAAHVAGAYIETIRDETASNPVEVLARAIERLEEALEEAKKVQTHVAHVAAYSKPDWLYPSESLGEDDEEDETAKHRDYGRAILPTGDDA